MTIKVEPIDEPTPEMAASDRLQEPIESQPIEHNGDSYQLTDLDAFQNNQKATISQQTIRQHSNADRDTLTSTQTTTSLSPSPPPSPELETPSSPESFLSEIDIESNFTSESIATTTTTTTSTAQLIRANNDTHSNQHDDNHSLQDSQPMRKRSNSGENCYQARDRAAESRLTEQQSEQLDKLIASIVEGNDFNEFKQLVEKLSRGAKRNLLNVYVDGRTALHYSLIYGRSLKWCKQLIVNGANPNLTNRAGWHPIHLAAYNSSRETMLYLIDCLSN